MNTNKYQLTLDPGTGDPRILGFLDMTEEEAARFRTLISGEFATFHSKGAPHLPLTISGPLEPYVVGGKVYDPAVKAILDNATAWAERKKAEGWTKADFARGLKEFFEEENANAQARAAMRPGSILDHVTKRVEEKLNEPPTVDPGGLLETVQQVQNALKAYRHDQLDVILGMADNRGLDRNTLSLRDYKALILEEADASRDVADREEAINQSEANHQAARDDREYASKLMEIANRIPIEVKPVGVKDANPYPAVALLQELEGKPAGTRGTRVDVNFTDADVEWWDVELADGVVVTGQAIAFEIIQNVELVITLKGNPTAKQAKRVTDAVGHKPVSISQSPGTGQNAIFYFIVKNENTAYGIINKVNRWDFVVNCKINPSITTDKEKSNE
jgi:hypothetical protein